MPIDPKTKPSRRLQNKLALFFVVIFSTVCFCVFVGCTKKNTHSEDIAVPSQPLILVEDNPDLKDIEPPIPLMELCNIPFDKNDYNFYGSSGTVDSENPEDAWQCKLFRGIKEDIAWGLENRKADITGMILIPAGETIVGDDTNIADITDALKKEVKNINAYYIDKYEITNEKYMKCVKDRQCLPFVFIDHIPKARVSNHPALITYKQAERYCLWAGKKLPSEYEWEKAARGTDGRYYPWGNEKPKAGQGNICGESCNFNWAEAGWVDGYKFTSPVGAFPKGDSPYGVSDMSDNVKEWVVAATKRPPNELIARGASWYSTKTEMLSVYRQLWKMETRLDDKGARCVFEAK